MKISIKVLIVILIAFLGKESYAQNQKYDRILNIGYNAGIPIGGLNNFIKGKNFDGLSIDGRYFVTNNISLGISTGWSSFSKKYARQVYSTQDGEISAVQTRYFRSVPILFTAQYYLNNGGEKINPYVGAGIGAYQLRYEKWYGPFIDGKGTWTFGLRPEAGVLIPITDKFGVNVNARYNLALYTHQEINNLNYIEGSVGAYFHFY